MRAVPPLEMNDTRLVSTTASEPATGETEYNGATSYAVGNEAISVAVHRTYKSITGGSGHALPVYPETENDDWLDVGPTKAWAMFDLDRNSKSSFPSPLTVVIQPGEKIDSWGAFGVVADEATITVTRGADTLWTETIPLVTRRVTGWYSWYTTAFATRPSIVRHNLPARSGVTVEITFTRGAGDVSVGALVLGRFVYIGKTQHGAQSERLNFSKIDRDADGNSVLTRKRNVPKTTQNVRVAKGNALAVLELADLVNAKPTLWTGLDDQDSGYFEPLLILGVLKGLTIDMDQPNEAMASIQLEEV